MSEPSPPASSEASTVDQVLLDHAVLCWESERENAERLSKRMTLLLSGSVALLAVGLFRAMAGGRFPPEGAPTWLLVAADVLALAAVLSFLGSFWVSLRIRLPGRRRSVRATSSVQLRFTDAELAELPGSPDRQRRLVFVRTYRAFLDLVARNAEERSRVDKSQQCFFVGLTLACMSLILAMFGFTIVRHDHGATERSSEVAGADGGAVGR